MNFNQLKLCSYNIHGFNLSKINYINDLLKQFTVLFIEEHWLSEDQLGKFAQYFPGFSVHGVSALDSSVLLRGRPHGGCLVIYRDSLGGGGLNTLKLTLSGYVH